MNKVVRDRTVVYNVGYHLVWSVKYRRKALVGKIEKSLLVLLHEVSLDKGFVLRAVEIMPDHVHVFVSSKPKNSPSYIYKMLKGISSRKLFLCHPELKNILLGDKLWNPSTYVETIGHVSEETVKKYIEDQKEK